MIKLVFVDMDGTFLLPDKTVSEENLRVLDLAYEAGVQFVPCTGRNISGLPRELVEHPCVKYAVCCNGALICEVSSGKVIHEVDIDRNTAIDLYESVGDLPITFDLFADGTVYTVEERWPLIDRLPLTLAGREAIKAMRTRDSRDLGQLLRECGPICRVNVFYLDEDTKNAVWRAVDAAVDLRRASSLPCNIEITNVDAHKGSGLKWLCDYLGVDPRDTIAFGDASNDVTMLEAAGDGVAMGNALPEAIAASDHMTCSNAESGVAKYLEPILVRSLR